MDAQWWKEAGTDRKGYYGHSSICQCSSCMSVYENHSAGYQICSCLPCVHHNIAINDPFRTDEKGTPQVATVNFCDRCESMGKSHVMGSMSFRTDASKKDVSKELCPGCIGELMEWLENDITTTRQKAYKEPWSPDDNETSGEIITEGGQAIKAIAAAVRAEMEKGNAETDR